MSELFAAVSVFGAISVIISFNNPNTLKTAIFYDLFWFGIVALIMQLCDNYLFLNRFQAVKQVPRWKLISIHLFIWIFITLPWLPTYTIIPFFFDTNSESYWHEWNKHVLPVVFWSSLIYNCYFTYEFIRILPKFTFIQAAQLPIIKK